MSRAAEGVIAVELLLAALGAAAGLVTAGDRAGSSSGATQAANRWVFSPQPVHGYAEARCRYDLALGPVRVTAEPAAGALSVSIIAADGRSLLSADERSAPQGVDVVLALNGQAAPRGGRVVISPSREGQVLERRRADTPERFAAAEQARQGDMCGPTGVDFPAVPQR